MDQDKQARTIVVTIRQLFTHIVAAGIGAWAACCVTVPVYWAEQHAHEMTRLSMIPQLLQFEVDNCFGRWTSYADMENVQLVHFTCNEEQRETRERIKTIKARYSKPQ